MWLKYTSCFQTNVPNKTNKMTCAPSEDSNQPGHPPSLIRGFAVRMKKHWAHSEDSDQTGQMPRLSWVFAGRTVILLVLSWGGSYYLSFVHFIMWAKSLCIFIYLFTCFDKYVSCFQTNVPNKVDIKVTRKNVFEDSYRCVMAIKKADILKTR